MKGDLSFHVLSIVIGLIVSIISFLLSSLMPPSFQAQGVGVAIILGLTTTVVYDRIYYSQKLSEVRKDIIQTLRVGNHYKAGYTIYRTERQALEYLIRMIPSAVMVKNTRLSGVVARGMIGTGHRVISAHDRAVVTAVEAGADFRLVCDKSDPEGVDLLKEELEKAKKSDTYGSAILHLVEFGNSPVLQMIILSYADGSSEALVGWELAGDVSTNPAVIAFRDSDIVEVLNSIFDKYAARGGAEPL